MEHCPLSRRVAATAPRRPAGAHRVARRTAPAAPAPWPVQRLPAVFTPFRQQIEQVGLQPFRALPPPCRVTPAPPVIAQRMAGRFSTDPGSVGERHPPPMHAAPSLSARRSARRQCRAGPPAASWRADCPRLQAHAQRSAGAGLSQQMVFGHRPRGALAAPGLAQLRQFEAEHGASDGSYAVV